MSLTAFLIALWLGFVLMTNSLLIVLCTLAVGHTRLVAGWLRGEDPPTPAWMVAIGYTANSDAVVVGRCPDELQNGEQLGESQPWQQDNANLDQPTVVGVP